MLWLRCRALDGVTLRFAAGFYTLSALGMATLFLMVGLPGAGKTTRAKELERQRPALRLTPDEWMVPLGLDPYGGIDRERVEALQWSVAARALELGVDVILDFGFWGRAERDELRARAAALGAQTVVCFLDVSRAELVSRLEARNSALPAHTYRVDVAWLDDYMRLFEPPDARELEPSLGDDLRERSGPREPKSEE